MAPGHCGVVVAAHVGPGYVADHVIVCPERTNQMNAVEQPVKLKIAQNRYCKY